MRKFLLISGMVFVLAHTAYAWRPSGWVYHDWPWAYDSASGDWYSLTNDGSQWVYGFPPAVGWQVLDSSCLAHGWSFHIWPFAYCSSDDAWYYLNSSGSTWCYCFGSDFWSLLGQVVPKAGFYLSSIQRYFTVSRHDVITMVATFCPQNYTGYDMLVLNGAFHFQHGIVEGNRNSDSPALYPTDGFVMDGHFTSPTQAVGQVSFVFDGHITSTTGFVMSFNPEVVNPVY